MHDFDYHQHAHVMIGSVVYEDRKWYNWSLYHTMPVSDNPLHEGCVQVLNESTYKSHFFPCILIYNTWIITGAP